jgi:peptide-methionine (R)-S-oxide reductase
MENKFVATKTDEEWKKLLTEEEYYVLRKKGTERPFSGEYEMFYNNGIYTCKGCGEELFTSANKFDAGCGWPSFDKAIANGKIIENKDFTHGMVRKEIVCANCGSHLGHVFDDGPTETGLRYCVNSVSLGFKGE